MRYEILKYERIRNLRIDKNISQKTIAEKFHIAQTTYSQYELGERAIPTEILSAIADFHNTSTDYLLGRTDIMKPYQKHNKSVWFSQAFL